MPTLRSRNGLVTVTASAIMLAGNAYGGDVDMLLTPVSSTVEPCEIIEVNLVVMSDDASDQPFDALDAIIHWDPAILQLIGIDDSRSGGSFFISAFLPDPDGINDDVSDGEALYTALASPGIPAEAPAAPGELIVTTFQFLPLVCLTPSDVTLIPEVGAFGRTRVLFQGALVTGSNDDSTTVQCGTCTGDINVDGQIDVLDLLRVILAWGPCGCCGDCCAEDLIADGQVNVLDLITVLTAWGTCP